MSLMRMGKPSESVRFLDDVDLTFSLDNRSSLVQEMISMEISAKPIVFRTSYRDIKLITSIVNKAIELYSNSQKSNVSGDEAGAVGSMTRMQLEGQSAKSFALKSRLHPVGNARILMSKEQVSRTTNISVLSYRRSAQRFL
jgi:vacuolar protein sorting-associated protein 13A/C